MNSPISCKWCGLGLQDGHGHNCTEVDAFIFCSEGVLYRSAGHIGLTPIFALHDRRGRAVPSGSSRSCRKGYTCAIYGHQGTQIAKDYAEARARCGAPPRRMSKRLTKAKAMLDAYLAAQKGGAS